MIAAVAGPWLWSLSLTGTARRVRCGMLFFPLPGIFFRYTCDIYRITNRSSKLKYYLVDVTPTPVFIRLEGLDNRVVGRVKMPGGVLILRRIATAEIGRASCRERV